MSDVTGIGAPFLNGATCHHSGWAGLGLNPRAKPDVLLIPSTPWSPLRMLRLTVHVRNDLSKLAHPRRAVLPIQALVTIA